jgi:hypothetical protein
MSMGTLAPVGEVVWFGNPGIINTAVLLIIILLSMGCYKLSICDPDPGYNPGKFEKSLVVP